MLGLPQELLGAHLKCSCSHVTMNVHLTMNEPLTLMVPVASPVESQQCDVDLKLRAAFWQEVVCLPQELVGAHLK